MNCIAVGRFGGPVAKNLGDGLRIYFGWPTAREDDPEREAEALFGQSLEIARRQEAETFELRAATSLARLWQRQGERDASPGFSPR